MKTVSQEDTSTNWGKLVDLECQSHLYLLGNDLDTFMQAMAKNDFESVSLSVFALFYNMHTLFEQLMQKAYVAEHGEVFLDSHRLTDLLKKTSSWKKLGISIETLVEKIDAASLWTRYTMYFEQQYSKKSKKSLVFEKILFSLNMMKSLQKEPLKLNEEVISNLKDLTKEIFQTTTTAYECLFQCIKELGEESVPDEILKQWELFLKKGNGAIQKHLDSQKGVMVKTIIPNSNKKQCNILIKTLERIQKDLPSGSYLQMMDYGNPIIYIEEAQQHIERFLATIKMLNMYKEPISTASHFGKLLGAMQWIIEKLLDAQCILDDIPSPLTHNFEMLQQLLMNNSLIVNSSLLNEEIQEKNKKKNERANVFHSSIGVNYPHLYEKKKTQKWLKEYEDLLTIFPQAIKASGRREIDEDNISKFVEAAIVVIQEQVDNTLNALTIAKNKVSKNKL